MLDKAVKQLTKIPKKEADKIATKIENLSENPQPSGCKKLTGYENVYRIHQGKYRILYEVRNNQLIVLVIKIGHRKDIYGKK